jgi:hypothetical protein
MSAEWLWEGLVSGVSVRRGGGLWGWSQLARLFYGRVTDPVCPGCPNLVLLGKGWPRWSLAAHAILLLLVMEVEARLQVTAAAAGAILGS